MQAASTGSCQLQEAEGETHGNSAQKEVPKAHGRFQQDSFQDVHGNKGSGG